ncbi:hypothetical protein B7P43_G07181 [Cryptotermes secundus]|uniref:Odorant receptor n=1 Tax=Cryptotermes secundus TaxID=105785 RepID=A0A2J7PJQ4_9NEOP|nr:hypothetical protein B7P43_G07181 [Cryptotermes secundus]
MSTVGLKEKRNTIFDSANKKARQITVIVMITLDVMVAAWIPTPFIKRLMEEHNNATNYEIEDEKKWLNFCYIIWFPIDITKSPYFEIMYFMECIVFLIATTYRKALDTTVAAMMVHISAQFQILYTALEDMDAIMFLAEEEEEKKKYVRELRFLESRKLSGRTENMSLGGEPQYTGLGSPVRHDIQEWKVCDNVVDTDIEDGWMEKEDLPELTRYLANFVEYHQTVIDFASDVNKAVGPIFFVCFFVRQFLGCVTSFQVALSRELQKAAFECQWYKHSKAMKHFLLMITVRSQKAVYLSGCQYYVVSLQTFGKAYVNQSKAVVSGKGYKRMATCLGGPAQEKCGEHGPMGLPSVASM